MISTYKYKDLLWTDLQSPTEEEFTFTEEDLPRMQIKELVVFDTPLKIMRSGNTIITIHDKHFEFLDHARYRLESAHQALNNPFSEKVEYVHMLILEELAKAYHKDYKAFKHGMHAELAHAKKSSQTTNILIAIIIVVLIALIVLL